MATTSLVPQAAAGPCRTTSNTATHNQDSVISSLRCSLPPQQQAETDCMPGVRRHYEMQGISDGAVQILMASWRTSTQKEYKVYLDKWHNFCSRRSADPFLPSIRHVVDFLSALFKDRTYSTVNIARSALSAMGIKIDGVTVGSHPTVVRLLKGMHNIKPPRAKYTATWDPDIVLRHLATLVPIENISLKDLTLKLCMLLALTQAARPQTIHLITINNLIKEANRYIFQLSGLLKHNKPGVPIPVIEVHKYPHDNSLCPYTVVTEYLNRTSDLRSNLKDKLLLSYVKPHNPITVDTIRRWLKQTMEKAGIDVNRFGSYSTRSASASKAASSNFPMNLIMKAAGWSRQSTFERFYLRDIEPQIQLSDHVLRMDQE